MEYRAKLFGFRCPCGNSADYVKVGTTSDGCLIAVWHCAACDQDVSMRVPLEELIRDLPEAPEQKLISAPTYTTDDVALLNAMHIKLEET